MSNNFLKIFSRAEYRADVMRPQHFQDLHREMFAVLEHVAKNLAKHTTSDRLKSAGKRPSWGAA